MSNSLYLWLHICITGLAVLIKFIRQSDELLLHQGFLAYRQRKQEQAAEAPLIHDECIDPIVQFAK